MSDVHCHPAVLGGKEVGGEQWTARDLGGGWWANFRGTDLFDDDDR